MSNEDLDRERGLYHKYTVYRTVDGVPATEPVEEFCFVLCPEKDPAAVVALQAYADWCWENGYDYLAEDLEAVLDT